MHVKGYIFDIDHTLINSDKAHIDSAIEAFNNFGLDRTWEEITRYFDTATDEIFELVTNGDYDNPAEIAAEKSKIF